MPGTESVFGSYVINFNFIFGCKFNMHYTYKNMYGKPSENGSDWIAEVSSMIGVSKGVRKTVGFGIERK